MSENGNGHRYLTFDDIVAANDLPEDEVEVPEWGGWVRVRGFSKRAQMDMRTQAKVGGEIDSDRLEMLMLVAGVIEPAMTAEQGQALLGKSQAAFDRVLGRVIELSGGGAQPEANKRRFRGGR